jgi:hypothetical protein
MSLPRVFCAGTGVMTVIVVYYFEGNKARYAALGDLTSR